MEQKQTKSKQRISEHGEVFTNEREVNAMLDLVKIETERIESRFLEPACGNGNFLAEILRRKLKIVHLSYSKNIDDWEFYSILAISSMYGIELLEDNCIECRERLYKIWENAYREIGKETIDDECIKAAKFILERNILCGDALSLKDINNEPIIFSEWTALNNCLIKRRDFRLDEILEGKKPAIQLSLFEQEKNAGWVYDEDTKSYFPAPIKEYEPAYYKMLYGI